MQHQSLFAPTDLNHDPIFPSRRLLSVINISTTLLRAPRHPFILPFLTVLAFGCAASVPGKPGSGTGGASASPGTAGGGGSGGSLSGTAGGGAGTIGVAGSGIAGADAGAVGATGAAGSGAAGTSVDAGAPMDASLAPFTGFGPSVLVFDPGMAMTDIQAQIDAAYATQYTGQFATSRFAFLFKPGAYALDVKVGYYTQVVGLGAAPDDVTVTGAIRSMGNATGNATLSFWRATENVAVMPTGGVDVWAISQGASFRRMHIEGNLNLADSGTSSGGFIADSKIDGRVTSGSQQQYFTRNTEWTAWQGGVWNMVFVGVPTPPTGAWPTSPYTTVDKAPLVQEKPFLTIDAGGAYAVVVPTTRANVAGASWTTAATPATTVPLSDFYVARAGRDSAAAMNLALAQGKHLLLEPGVYHLDDSLRVTKAGTIVLGLGLATLAADTGAPALTVAEVDGVKIAGLIVDAGSTGTATLIQVGAPGAGQAHATAPTWLYDLSCRVGGGQLGTATTCLTIDSGDVVGDNLWLWRADHGVAGSTGWAVNAAKHGLVVNGRNVTM
jgi:hypothetical protein